MSSVEAYPHRVSLELLGARILVRCAHEQCRDDVRDYFGNSVLERSWSSPDVIVDCTWSTASRYLFRDRPSEEAGTPLEGVRVHVAGQSPPDSEWKQRRAPLPPLNEPPFVDRFVVVHAGAVVLPDGGAVMLVGDKGAGKTTLSTALTNEYGCHLLTDEATFLHRRTALAEPFARAVGVAEHFDRLGRLEKRPRPAPEVCARVATEPALVRAVVLLQRDESAGERELVPSDPLTCYRSLAEQNFDASSSHSESLVTLAGLARTTRSIGLVWSTYEGLRTAGAALLEELATPRAGVA